MANGTRSTASPGTAWRTMASARPTASTAVLGAMTRSARRRAATARTVNRSGSPGPTPTPTSRPGTGRSTGADAVAGSRARPASSASLMSAASERPVAWARAARAAFNRSGRYRLLLRTPRLYAPRRALRRVQREANRATGPGSPPGW
jgi:hypothetical protein